MPSKPFVSRVTVRHIRKEQLHVQFRMHSMLCDHPPELGGDDTGPTPSEFLLASLACSIAQHLGRHAARLKAPVESVEVKTDFEVGSEKGQPPLDPVAHLSRAVAKVEIKGNLTPQQFEALKYIAENVPVARTLRRGLVPEIPITLTRG